MTRRGLATHGAETLVGRSPHFWPFVPPPPFPGSKIVAGILADVLETGNVGIGRRSARRAFLRHQLQRCLDKLTSNYSSLPSLARRILFRWMGCGIGAPCVACVGICFPSIGVLRSRCPEMRLSMGLSMPVVYPGASQPPSSLKSAMPHFSCLCCFNDAPKHGVVPVPSNPHLLMIAFDFVGFGLSA